MTHQDGGFKGDVSHGNPFEGTFMQYMMSSREDGDSKEEITDNMVSDSFCRDVDAALVEEERRQSFLQSEDPTMHLASKQPSFTPGKHPPSNFEDDSGPSARDQSTSVRLEEPEDTNFDPPRCRVHRSEERTGCFGGKPSGEAHMVRNHSAVAVSSGLSGPSPVTERTLVSPAMETGVSCRDFNNEAGAYGPEIVPVGARFRRQSLQVATKVLETHIKRPRVQLAESSATTTEICLPEQGLLKDVPYDRSASPILLDDDDDDDDYERVPGSGSQEGILGIILDLYKFQARGVLEATLLEDSSRAHMPRNVRGRSGGSRTSSAAPSLSHEQAFERQASGPDDLGSASTIEGMSSAADSCTSTCSSVAESAKSLQDKKRQRRKGQLRGRPHWPEDEQTITHISEAIRKHITRQLYLIRLCRALMTYGAPTHRLEAYMGTSARAIGMNAQFMYLPNCMIISFIDNTTQTTKVSIVTAPQSVDLGRMRDAHEVYLHVVHKRINLEEGMDRLEDIMARGPKFKPLVRVLMYGFSCACVAPFGFEGRLIDLPLAFVMGTLLGLLQLVLAPANQLFSNVFEIVAAILMAFLARMLGSINDGSLFCFSALAQSGIANILPGYVVLCASLELQTKHLVAGAVRLIYAMFYTLFLGYGITIGAVLYGYTNKNATSVTTCPDPLPKEWNILFVTLFTICVSIINQAKWKQMPIMLFIAVAGYVVNWQAAVYFKGASAVSNTLGALAVGVLANLYSRLGRYPSMTIDLWNRFMVPFFKHTKQKCCKKHERDLEKGRRSTMARSKSSRYVPRRIEARVGYGLASAAMLPAIFVQVPSGIAVGGSLVSGVTSADWIVSDEVGETAIEDISAAAGVAFNVTISVIQVAISIAVGLCLAALIVYPLEWKKRQRKTGLSSL